MQTRGLLFAPLEDPRRNNYSGVSARISCQLTALAETLSPHSLGAAHERDDPSRAENSPISKRRDLFNESYSLCEESNRGAGVETLGIFSLR